MLNAIFQPKRYDDLAKTVFYSHFFTLSRGVHAFEPVMRIRPRTCNLNAILTDGQATSRTSNNQGV